jgi:hypothetical protein
LSKKVEIEKIRKPFTTLLMPKNDLWIRQAQKTPIENKKE